MHYSKDIRDSVKKKIIIISVIIYAIALVSFVGMYSKTEKSIAYYNSILPGYSQPLQAYSASIENPEAKTQLIAEQIREMNTVLTRKPSNLDIGYELLELAKKNNLEIVSFSSRGVSKQNIIKAAYEVQSFNLSVTGSNQNIINIIGDLQIFRLGSLLIDGINISQKKETVRADIYFSLYSKEVKAAMLNAEPAKDKGPVTDNRDTGKTLER